MRMMQSLCGTLLIEITSAEPEKAMEEIARSGISITDITKKSDLIYQFCVLRKDYFRISEILQKREDKLTVLFKHGIYWTIISLLHKPYLISTIFIIMILTIYLPTRILSIEVEGNEVLSENEILVAAETCGISFGSSRKLIRSEKVKNELLSIIPKLQWTGINTTGCRAVISVRERTETAPSTEENFIGNLIAHQDAFILSTTVTSGVAMVRPGDIVMKGQTLISGYADHGSSIYATKATGEILGLTNRTLTAIMPSKYLHVTEIKDVKHKISLLVRKKRINLWKDSRISNACCGRMYEEYYVSLPGGYQLPIAICIDRYFDYETENTAVPEADVYPMLQQFSDSYLINQMVAGQILQKHHQIISSEGMYLLKSNYTCSEMIGKEQREQIGDYNGKRN